MGFHPQLDSAIWPGIWNPLWDQRFEVTHGYDPAQARALLAQAGYPQGFAFTLYLYTLPGLAEIIDIGQAMALDFQAIGSSRSWSNWNSRGCGNCIAPRLSTAGYFPRVTPPAPCKPRGTSIRPKMRRAIGTSTR